MRCIVYFLSLVVLMGCQKDATDSPVTEGKLELTMFSAPWCKVCNKELPELNAYIKNELKSSRLRAKVIVSTGEFSDEDPSPQVATDYAKKYGLDVFEVVSDTARLKLVSETMGDSRLPSGIIFDEKGNRVKEFKFGQFRIVDVKDYLKDNLK